MFGTVRHILGRDVRKEERVEEETPGGRVVMGEEGRELPTQEEG